MADGFVFVRYLRKRRGLGGFDFEVHEGEAGFGCRLQDVQLLGKAAGEASAEGLTAAGGDGGYFLVSDQKLGDGRVYRSLSASFRSLVDPAVE